MKKKTRRVLILLYLTLGIIGIHFLGEAYATRMMKILSDNPSPDLYANNHGFQYMIFWLSRGLALMLILIFSAVFLYKVWGSGDSKKHIKSRDDIGC